MVDGALCSALFMEECLSYIPNTPGWLRIELLLIPASNTYTFIAWSIKNEQDLKNARIHSIQVLIGISWNFQM